MKLFPISFSQGRWVMNPVHLLVTWLFRDQLSQSWLLRVVLKKHLF